MEKENRNRQGDDETTLSGTTQTGEGMRTPQAWKTSGASLKTPKTSGQGSERQLMMKDMPPKDRPYEKCEREGVKALTDAELLAILIRTGNRNESALALASRILAQAHPPGILGLLHLTLPELMEQKGIGKVKGIELLCVGELSQRIWRALTLEEAPAFTTPGAIAAFYKEEMRHKEQEEMHLMMLNTKQVLIREMLLFRGTINHSPASPREIFIEALRYHAASVVLVHNHPSGDPTPSAEDRRTTARIQEVGAILGIHLLDHVIIGEQAYFSFKERGIL